MIEIYSYIDYRLFLKDFLAEKSTEESGLTQREINAALGINSTGYIANVIAGKNSLPIKRAKILAQLMKLSPNQSDYFKYMVYFGKAKTLDEKNDFYETLSTLRRKKLKKLSPSQLSLFSKWYYVVIREVLNYFPFTDDYKALAKMVDPPITPGDAKEAVAELCELGLIKKNDEGRYVQVDALISTGDDVQSYYVVNFQRSMIDLEKRALTEIDSQERDISGVTVSVSEDGFRKIKAEISDLRKRVLKIASEDVNTDQVFRCNFQVFPVSKKGGE